MAIMTTHMCNSFCFRNIGKIRILFDHIKSIKICSISKFKWLSFRFSLSLKIYNNANWVFAFFLADQGDRFLGYSQLKKQLFCFFDSLKLIEAYFGMLMNISSKSYDFL